MVSVAVSKLGCTELFFVEPRLKVAGEHCAKFRWRSRCCQSHRSYYWQHVCVPARQVHLHTILTKQSSSCSRKHWIFSPDLWPSNSPDLNPVDYRIWRLMQERVYKTLLYDTSDLKHHLINIVGQHITKCHLRSCWSIEKAVTRMPEGKRTSLCTSAKLKTTFFRATTLHNQLLSEQPTVYRGKHVTFHFISIAAF